MDQDDYVLVCRQDAQDNPRELGPQYLHDVSNFIESISDDLWIINKKIHDNPELGYKEYKAHALLTTYLKSQKGWKVTASAYGMDTAWVAVYDSGQNGPVVSLNIEMGELFFFFCQ
jgi:metal-dependent amidase/aminoacylase/carboxypeptidase family protein